MRVRILLGDPVENKVYHNWVQHSLMNDICTKCGEIAFGNLKYGGVEYPDTFLSWQKIPIFNR